MKDQNQFRIILDFLIDNSFGCSLLSVKEKNIIIEKSCRFITYERLLMKISVICINLIRQIRPGKMQKIHLRLPFPEHRLGLIHIGH